MQTLNGNQIDSVGGGLINPISGLGWGFVGYCYGRFLLAAAGLEGGAAALVGGTAIYVASQLPALPPPTEGGAFYVHKQ